jgi:hypothetical protein
LKLQPKLLLKLLPKLLQKRQPKLLLKLLPKLLQKRQPQKKLLNKND